MSVQSFNKGSQDCGGHCCRLGLIANKSETDLRSIANLIFNQVTHFGQMISSKIGSTLVNSAQYAAPSGSHENLGDGSILTEV